MVVTFTNAGNSLSLPSAVGEKAGAVIPHVRNVMNVNAGATVTINGETVMDNYVFKDGDNILFYKPSGDKGRD
jgi:hypothetical protein